MFNYAFFSVLSYDFYLPLVARVYTNPKHVHENEGAHEQMDFLK